MNALSAPTARFDAVRFGSPWLRRKQTDNDNETDVLVNK